MVSFILNKNTKVLLVVLAFILLGADLLVALNQVWMVISSPSHNFINPGLYVGLLMALRSGVFQFAVLIAVAKIISVLEKNKNVA